jgi:hypothetical protein
MAKFDDGILGAFKGKIGPVVGCVRDGQPYMRSLPRYNENRTISDKENANRIKFSLTQQWLQPITEFVRLGYKNYPLTRGKGFVAAKSELSKNAVKGESPDLFIDPALALVSYGDLPGAPAAEVSVQPGIVEFIWDTAVSDPKAKDNDQVMLLLYDTASFEAFYNTSGAKRKTGKDIIELPEGSSGLLVEAYIAFVSDDRKECSKSQYLGQIALP